MVVPEEIKVIEDFRALHKLGYIIALPSSLERGISTILKQDRTPFQGVDYIDALRNDAIYHAAKKMYSSEFLTFIATKPKRATLQSTPDVGWYKRILEQKFPQKHCLAGKKPHANRL